MGDDQVRQTADRSTEGAEPIKKSVNFTGKKPGKPSHVLDLMKWVGMTDEEIKAALTKQKEASK